MPFTLAHPAIVLPFKYLPKRWVSMTGLVIGSMAPDFEYFIRLRVKSIYSHTLPGLFWFDIPLGLLLLIIYERFVKNELIDHLPVSLNRRFSKYKYVANTSLLFNISLVVVVSIFTGAVSHIIWNGFTHPTGWFVNAIPALSVTVNLAGHCVYFYKVLQHGSTFAGIAFIVLTIWFLPQEGSSQSPHFKLYWFVVILVTALSVCIRLLTGISPHQYGNMIVSSISGGILGVLTASLISKRFMRA